ncbi:unnamed protein product [Adineta ricciae]|uniref:Uncharacterized protein n=1 Tax=Adineta ricciae TaxID=249248 RepID=A0A816FWA6_ADIRI|nr:unnamed protein product [Adineta ricciae]
MPVYIFIWVGYILAFYMICKDIMEQFLPFNFVPKLLAMFIGEYDVDGTFFPNNNQLLPGAEGALILYSAFIFTMFVVMTNIMGGLAVADVKEFRLNAKREHLRSRIEVILGLQVYLGGFCETIGSIIMKIYRNPKWHYFLKILGSMGPKYQLEKLRIISNPVDIPYPIIEVEQNESLQHPLVLSMNERLQQVCPQTGFYIHHLTISSILIHSASSAIAWGSGNFVYDPGANYQLVREDSFENVGNSTAIINGALVYPPNSANWGLKTGTQFGGARNFTTSI